MHHHQEAVQLRFSTKLTKPSASGNKPCTNGTRYRASVKSYNTRVKYKQQGVLRPMDVRVVLAQKVHSQYDVSGKLRQNPCNHIQRTRCRTFPLHTQQQTNSISGLNGASIGQSYYQSLIILDSLSNSFGYCLSHKTVSCPRIHHATDHGPLHTASNYSK